MGRFFRDLGLAVAAAVAVNAALTLYEARRVRCVAQAPARLTRPHAQERRIAAKLAAERPSGAPPPASAATRPLQRGGGIRRRREQRSAQLRD